MKAILIYCSVGFAVHCFPQLSAVKQPVFISLVHVNSITSEVQKYRNTICILLTSVALREASLIEVVRKIMPLNPHEVPALLVRSTADFALKEENSL